MTTKRKSGNEKIAKASFRQQIANLNCALRRACEEYEVAARGLNSALCEQREAAESLRKEKLARETSDSLLRSAKDDLASYKAALLEYQLLQANPVTAMDGERIQKLQWFLAGRREGACPARPTTFNSAALGRY